MTTHKDLIQLLTARPDNTQLDTADFDALIQTQAFTDVDGLFKYNLLATAIRYIETLAGYPSANLLQEQAARNIKLTLEKEYLTRGEHYIYLVPASADDLLAAGGGAGGGNTGGGSIALSADGITLQLIGTVFSIAMGGVTTDQLADNAVTNDKILDGTIEYVKFSDSTLQTIADDFGSGLVEVSRDTTLTGDGTTSQPLGITTPIYPSHLSSSYNALQEYILDTPTIVRVLWNEVAAFSASDYALAPSQNTNHFLIPVARIGETSDYLGIWIGGNAVPHKIFLNGYDLTDSFPVANRFAITVDGIPGYSYVSNTPLSTTILVGTDCQIQLVDAKLVLQSHLIPWAFAQSSDTIPQERLADIVHDLSLSGTGKADDPLSIRSPIPESHLTRVYGALYGYFSHNNEAYIRMAWYPAVGELTPGPLESAATPQITDLGEYHYVIPTPNSYATDINLVIWISTASGIAFINGSGPYSGPQQDHFPRHDPGEPIPLTVGGIDGWAWRAQPDPGTTNQPFSNSTAPGTVWVVQLADTLILRGGDVADFAITNHGAKIPPEKLPETIPLENLPAIPNPPAQWAVDGDTSLIPDTKLSNIPATWAVAEDNSLIPDEKLAVKKDTIYPIRISTTTTLPAFINWNAVEEQSSDAAVVPTFATGRYIVLWVGVPSIRLIEVRNELNVNFSSFFVNQGVTAITVNGLTGYQITSSTALATNVGGQTWTVYLEAGDIITEGSLAPWTLLNSTEEIPEDRLPTIPAAPATWAEDGNTTIIPTSKLPTIPAAPATWAENGNNTIIPTAKLPTIPAAPATWAEDGDATIIPSGKLPTYPTAPATWAETSNTDIVPYHKLHIDEDIVYQINIMWSTAATPTEAIFNLAVPQPSNNALIPLENSSNFLQIWIPEPDIQLIRFMDDSNVDQTSMFVNHGSLAVNGVEGTAFSTSSMIAGLGSSTYWHVDIIGGEILTSRTVVPLLGSSRQPRTAYYDMVAGDNAATPAIPPGRLIIGLDDVGYADQAALRTAYNADTTLTIGANINARPSRKAVRNDEADSERNLGDTADIQPAVPPTIWHNIDARASGAALTEIVNLGTPTEPDMRSQLIRTGRVHIAVQGLCEPVHKDELSAVADIERRGMVRFDLRVTRNGVVLPIERGNEPYERVFENATYGFDVQGWAIAHFDFWGVAGDIVEIGVACQRQGDYRFFGSPSLARFTVQMNINQWLVKIIQDRLPGE